MIVCYVSLHNHSAYSFLDSISRMEEMVERAKELGQPAIALTDHGVLHGMVKFYKACKDAGIKGILGMEAYVTQDASIKQVDKEAGERPYYHLLLLARNEQGLKNLIELSSRAFLEGYYYRPRVDYKMLSDLGKGLISSTTCISSEIARVILEDEEHAEKLARMYAGWFDEFFVELQAASFDDQVELNKRLVRLARKLGLPVIVTTDSHYPRAQDAVAHDMALAVRTGGKGDEKDRLRFSSNDFYIKSEEEVRECLLAQGIDKAVVEEAIQNTAYIAKACDVELELGKWKLPQAPVSEGFPSSFLDLRAKALGGLVQYVAKHGVDFTTYKQRLEYELEVIKEAGIADYLLIVADICRWADEQGIARGPGRGSVGGSLVAMCLGIHKLDPIRFGLSFERFFVPGRKNMPDIDLDFDPEKRSEVIEYLAQRYGRENIAAICTFQTLGTKQAIRDAFRVLKVTPPGESEPRLLSFTEVDEISESVPAIITDEETQERLKITIDRAIEESPKLAEFERIYPEAFELARRFEGLPRHLSKHAAGVAIAPGPIHQYLPIMRASEDSPAPLTQVSMEDVEALGLLKLDILGVDAVGVIDRCLKWIDDPVDLSMIDLEDPEIYKDLCSLHTFGVFQLNTPAGTNTTRQVRPTEFRHIVDILALDRPGPQKSGQASSYIHRKSGIQPVTYPHEAVKEVLEPTYGLMIYQEQIMAVCRILAGFSHSEADDVRKACGKKIQSLMNQLGEKFIQGCERVGLIDTYEAAQLWESIQKFGDYAFNKSHSVAYALLAYWTAWLKHYYPAPFLAAVMSVEAATSGKDRQAKIAEAVRECRRLGIEVLLPDVNLSDTGFKPEGGAVRWGLAAVRGIGEQAARAIIERRPYESLEDFFERVPKRNVTKRAMAALIAAGGFDRLVEGDDVVKKRIALLHRYFELRGEEAPKEVSMDRNSVLPIPVRGGPRTLSVWEEMLFGTQVMSLPFGTTDTWTLKETDDEVEMIVQIVDYTRKTITRGRSKGKQLVICRMDSAAGIIKGVIFPDALERCDNHLRRNAVVLVKGIKAASTVSGHELHIKSMRPLKEEAIA